MSYGYVIVLKVMPCPLPSCFNITHIPEELTVTLGKHRGLLGDSSGSNCVVLEKSIVVEREDCCGSGWPGRGGRTEQSLRGETGLCRQKDAF